MKSNTSARRVRVVLRAPRIAFPSFAARIYLGLLAERADVELVAIIDPSVARRGEAAGGVPVFADVAKAVAGGVEADLLLVTGDRPAATIRAALEHGWQVVCDELFADSLREQRALLALADERAVGLTSSEGSRLTALPTLKDPKLGARDGQVKTVVATWSRPALPSIGKDPALPSLFDVLPRTLLSILLRLDGAVPVQVMLWHDLRRPWARASIAMADGTVVTVTVVHELKEGESDRSRIVARGDGFVEASTLRSVLESVYEHQFDQGLRSARAVDPGSMDALVEAMRDAIAGIQRLDEGDYDRLVATAAVMAALRTAPVRGGWVPVDLAVVR